MIKMILSAALSILSLAATAQTGQEADSLRLDSLQNYDLDGVTVVSQRQLIKNDIDKLAYDVQADGDSKSKTLLEMLRKVPMVTVDGQDNIKIQGSASFKIYRNGHPDPSLQGDRASDVLKSIPANTIKKIEVITDPGAKEDAEGTTYILNIVMLDNARFGGVSGSLSAGYDFLQGYLNPSVYLMTKTGKLTMSVNYGLVNAPKKSQDRTIEQDYTYTESGRRMLQTSDESVTALIHFGSINASYELDSLNLLTLSGSGNWIAATGIDDWKTDATTQLYGSDGGLIYGYRTKGTYYGYDQNSYSGRLDFQHKTHLDGEVLTLSYMLSTNRNKTDMDEQYSDMQNMAFGYDGIRNNSLSRMTEHTFQIDYVRPFAKWHKFEVGAKYIDRTSKSDTDIHYMQDDSGTAPDDVNSRFEHNTRVGAAYAQWLFDKDKWSARAGLRYEYSYLGAKYLDGSADNFHKNLNDWVPSASVKYSFSNANSLKLSLSTSINRPGIGYLNPARTESPQTVKYGNPALNSSRVTKVLLNFTHVGSKLTWSLSPYVNWTNNQVGQVLFVNSANQQVSTYSGVQHDTWFGLSGYAQYQPWKGTQLMANGSIFRDIISNRSIQTQLAPNGYCATSWSGSYNVNLSQQLFWDISLSAGVGGSFGHFLDGIYEHECPNTYYYFSLQKSFLKDDRLTVNVSANDIFSPKKKSYESRYFQGEYTGSSRWIKNNDPSFSIRVSWRFGKLKASVKSVDTTIENNDLKGGSSSGIGGGGNSGGSR